MIFRRSALFLLAGAALWGCSTLQFANPPRLGADDWATEGKTSDRSHTQSVVAFASPLEEVWQYNADAAFGTASAVAGDGTLFLATRRGEVHALRVEDGSRRGVKSFGNSLNAPPLLGEGMLYVPIERGKYGLIAYDLRKADNVWRTREVGYATSPLLLGGALIAPALDGAVRGFDAQTGTVRWEARLDSLASFYAAPVAVSSSEVVVASDRGAVTRLDGAGQIVWTVQTEPVYSTPASDGTRLFVPTTRGRFHALDAQTGAAEWTAMGADSLVRFAAPAVAEGVVYVGGSDGVVRALDAQTGRALWTAQQDGTISAAPLVTADAVVVGTMGEQVVALDRETGALLWETTVRGRVKTAPIWHEGTLLVFSEPRNVYAFRAAPEAL